MMTYNEAHRVPLPDDREEGWTDHLPASSWVDCLEPDGFTGRHTSLPMTGDEARRYARAYLGRCIELGIGGMARLHLPDEHGRPNRRLVLMGPNPTDERED